MKINHKIENSTSYGLSSLKHSAFSQNWLKTNQTLVAIASNIKDYDLIVSGIQPSANIIIIDEKRDGVEQITAALTHYSASNLQIICHGSPGVLQLGKTALTTANIHQYHHLLAEWNVKNILLWSCEVAAGNTDFLNILHQLTGANIAASSHYVGNEENYSNWELEHQIGNVTESSIFTEAILESYSGLFTEPNNSFVTAQDIGVLGATRTFNDFVGTSDRRDYYEFTLDEISQVNLNLTGLEEAAQMYLVADLDNDGVLDNNEVIEGDFSNSTADKSLNEILVPGTYAILVETYYSDDNTNYTLTASATELPTTTTTDPGNSFVAALDIGSLETTQTFTDVVGSRDRRDYYEFTLDEISQVDLTLTGLVEPAQMYLVTDLDNDGVLDNNEVIEGNFSNSTADKSLNEILVPGTYAILVEAYYSYDNTSYNLTASATEQPSTNATDPGEDFNSALDLGRLGGTQTFTDAVGSVDRSDYYEFTLNQTTSTDIEVSLTGLTEPAQLYIVQDLDNDGVLDGNEYLEGSYLNSTADRRISASLSPGTYAILVYTADSDANTGYTLTTIAPGTPEPPDDSIEYDSQAFTVNGVYEPIAGDFNGDGNGDVLWYRPGTGADYIWSFNDNNGYESKAFTVNGDYTPIPGDFDGSGTTDILWYRPGVGADFIWSFNSDGSYDSKAFTVNGTYTPVTGDFDGSGTTDILWYRPGIGADFLWSFNQNGTYNSSPFTVNGTYTPVTGDFDGNNVTDILWYRPGTGNDFLWSFNGDGTYESEQFTVNGTYEAVEGDFNGDDIDDILWYSPGPGQDYIWAFKTGGSYDSEKFTVNGVYTPVVEDFDSNGYTDILWYRPGTGADYLWSFN
jgi:hypothetical protein